MKQIILPELDRFDRIRVMTENATQIHDRFEYERNLTEEEVAELQADFSENAIEQQKLEQERKLLLEEISEKLKPLKKAAKPMLLKIKNRRETVTEKVYVLEDDNTGELGTYNMDGELLRVDPPKAGDVRALKFNRIQTSEDEEGGAESLKKTA